ncbi:MAG: hypothetical protein Q8Q28_18085 [Pseudomonadota bacterium]|nr:hypothetical protein [Pseudomonadota bacterium]
MIHPYRLAPLTIALLLTGCATGQPSRTAELAQEAARATATAIAEIKTGDRRGDHQAGLVEVESIAQVPDIQATDLDPAAGNVHVDMAGKVADVLASLADRYGYALAFASDVDRARVVGIKLSRVSPEYALRRAALAAGLVAVIDAQTRSVTVADQAVYTFRVPPHVMQKLKAEYAVGGNPVSAGSGSSGGGSMGQAVGAVGGIEAKFKVTGESGNNAQALALFITQLAGANASVNVASDAGLVMVRGPGPALERVRDFLNRYTQVAMRRVEIQAAVVEITLTDEFAYGIDWSKVFGSGALKGTTLAISGAASVTNPAFTLSYAGASISSALNLLKDKTHLRVISQPSITAMNRTPATIFNGEQIPYVGSITPPVTTGTTVTNGSSTLSFAVDGLPLSVIPDILSDQQVDITLVPVISTVKELIQFDVGGGMKLSGPRQSSKQSLMQALVENGKTVVLGGIRQNSSNDSDKLTSGDRKSSATEIAILLQANIIPARRQDTLFTEAL